MESSPAFFPVEPVNPAAPYIGGKRALARRLIAMIETVPHKTYAEPFVGMGGVFLRRRLRPPAEVVNDWSCDVATFYRVLQRHYVALMDLLRWQITSRAEFERLVATDPSTLTDLERAARFLYLQRAAFGGKVNGRHFGVSHHLSGRFDVGKLAVQLEDIHARLSGVIIERLEWAAFIARYDTPETLFYLDPPYWGCEQDYGGGMFAREDFAKLRDTLFALQGRFIMSLNAAPGAIELFQDFPLERVRTSYGIGGHGARPADEIVITSRVVAG